jgi:hypothetical protein
MQYLHVQVLTLLLLSFSVHLPMTIRSLSS